MAEGSIRHHADKPLLLKVPFKGGSTSLDVGSLRVSEFRNGGYNKITLRDQLQYPDRVDKNDKHLLAQF